MISYHLPPPDDRTPKKQLLETIEFLERENIDEQAWLILEALAKGLIFSEESDASVRRLGKEIAQELYDCVTQNADHEDYLRDPQNPHNWE